MRFPEQTAVFRWVALTLVIISTGCSAVPVGTIVEKPVKFEYAYQKHGDLGGHGIYRGELPDSYSNVVDTDEKKSLFNYTRMHRGNLANIASFINSTNISESILIVFQHGEQAHPDIQLREVTKTDRQVMVYFYYDDLAPRQLISMTATVVIRVPRAELPPRSSVTIIIEKTASPTFRKTLNTTVSPLQGNPDNLKSPYFLRES